MLKKILPYGFLVILMAACTDYCSDSEMVHPGPDLGGSSTLPLPVPPGCI
jgi:hypothetical protein